MRLVDGRPLPRGRHQQPASAGAGIPSNTFINAIGPASSGTPACVAGQARISANLAAGADRDERSPCSSTTPTVAPSPTRRSRARTMTSSDGSLLQDRVSRTAAPKIRYRQDAAGHSAVGTSRPSRRVTSNTVVTVSAVAGRELSDRCSGRGLQDRLSLNLPAASPATTTRQVKDATFVAPNKVCSGTAALHGERRTAGRSPPTLVTGTVPQKFPAGDYITAVGATGCPAGTTEATLHANFITAGTNGERRDRRAQRLGAGERHHGRVS